MKKEPTNHGNEKEERLLHLSELRMGAQVLRAIKHKLRMDILYFIHKQGRVRVTMIYETLNLEQSLTSQHLGVLRRAGFVNCVREGTFIYYSVNVERVEFVHRMSGEMVKGSGY